MFPFFKAPVFDAADDFMRVGTELMTLGLEAHSVVMYRVMGLSGLWSVTSDENHRMFTEKPAAFAESMASAYGAAITGASPDKVMSAAIKPLRSKTSSNVDRLSKGGPKLGV